MAQRSELLRRSAELNKRSLYLVPSAAVLYVACAWAWADKSGLALWLCAVAVMTCVYFVAGRMVRSVGQTDIPQKVFVLYDLSFVLGGAIWGSFAFFARPEELVGQAVVLSLVITSLAGGFMMGGSHGASFYAFQTPMMLLSLVEVARMETGLAIAGSALVFFGFGYSAVLGVATRATYREAVSLAHSNEQLADRLGSLNRELSHSAMHDVLTDLPNRTAFQQAAEQFLGESGSEQHPGVLMVDLDRFKLVNDSLGHAAGDDLLIQVAQRLSGVLQEGETLFRLGGDEFVVLVDAASEMDQLMRVGERLLSGFEEPFQLGLRTFDSSISVGGAVASPGSTSSDILRRADAALYQAKDAGRSCVRMFDEAARKDLDRKFDSKAELDSALVDGRIRPWFQPVVEITTGRIHGFEGLARWVEDDQYRNAEEFMPLIEELEMGSALSLAVAPGVLQFHKELSEEFGTDPDAPMVGVNVEPWAIREFIDAYGQQDLSGLVIEVTERGLMEESGNILTAAQSAISRGAILSLDDFGRGYNALGAVAHFPFSSIKLDKSLVDDVDTNSSIEAIVVGLVAMARGLEVSLVAEGVETVSQAQKLANLGVKWAQGHLYSPALPPEAAMDLFGKQSEWGEFSSNSDYDLGERPETVSGTSLAYAEAG